MPDEKEHTQQFARQTCKEVRDIFGFSALMLGCWACLVNTAKKNPQRNQPAPPDVLKEALQIKDRDSRGRSHSAARFHSAMDI